MKNLLPTLVRQEAMPMYITFADLIQYSLVIIAVISLVIDHYKKK